MRGHQVDLTDSRVHGAFLVRTKVTDAWVQSLDLSGTISSLVVNGIEVAGYVRAELERRHPELAYLESRDIAGMQRAWAKVQEIAAATLASTPSRRSLRSGPVGSVEPGGGHLPHMA